MNALFVQVGIQLPQYAETVSQDVFGRLCVSIRDEATVGAAEHGVCSDAVVQVPAAGAGLRPLLADLRQHSSGYQRADIGQHNKQVLEFCTECVVAVLQVAMEASYVRGPMTSSPCVCIAPFSVVVQADVL